MTPEDITDWNVAAPYTGISREEIYGVTYGHYDAESNGMIRADTWDEAIRIIDAMEQKGG